MCSSFHCDVLVEGIRLHECAAHGSLGAVVKTAYVLVESRRVVEHVIHGHHGAGVNAVAVLAENLSHRRTCRT